MDSYDNEWVLMLDDDLFPLEGDDSAKKKSGENNYPHSQINPDTVCIFPDKH